jgi:CheY-like chemotaxis protein
MTATRRVFVIDDSEIARELAGLILESHGFEVQSSDTPFGIAPQLTSFQPHLILLDLRMPGLTEEKLPIVVSICRAACSAHVVLHSAHDPTEVARVVRHAAADGSIEKTEDDEAFVASVRRWTGD